MDDKLKQVLHKVELLCEQNPEFAAALREKFGANAELIESSNDKLDEMYEYCIERVVKKQAEEYYTSFPIEEIRNQLIQDYCRMERFRRQDNFGDFCLAAYQQVEGICKALATNEQVVQFIDRLWKYPAFVKIGEKDENGKFVYYKELDITKREGEITIEEMLLRNKAKMTKPLTSLTAYYLIRTLIYFIGYQTALKKSEKRIFDDFCNAIGNNLYLGRNLNHRGAQFEDWQQTIIDNMLQDKSAYYFKFLGDLVHFVEIMKEGIHNLPLLEKKINELPPID